jgi:hypothetical protein
MMNARPDWRETAFPARFSTLWHKKGPPDEPAAQVKGGNAQGGLRSKTTLAASHFYIAAPHKSQDIFRYTAKLQRLAAHRALDRKESRA